MFFFKFNKVFFAMVSRFVVLGFFKRPKNIFMNVFISVVVVLSSSSVLAAGNVRLCDPKWSETQAQFDAGRIVIAAESSTYTSCSGWTYTYAVPSSSTPIMCNPSTPYNMPVDSGYVVTGASNSYGSCKGNFGYAIKKPSTSSVEYVCNNSPIPPNYVVSNGYAEQYFCNDRVKVGIEKPDSTPGRVTTKCNSPPHEVPDGFVIVGIGKYSKCKSENKLTGPGVKVTTLRSGVETPVCHGSIVPAGWAYSSLSTSSKCDSGASFNISPVTQNTETICGRTNQHVPDGYVVTAIDRNSEYCGSYDSLTIKKPDSAGTRACQLVIGEYELPEGFVISSKEVNADCDGATGYTVKVPSETQEYVCKPSRVPNGWGVFAVELSDSCAAGSGNKGTRGTIKPLVGDGPFDVCSSQGLPSGFINNGYSQGWSCNATNSFVVTSQTSSGWHIVRPSATPGNATIVCGSTTSNIPNGYAVVEHGEYTNCAFPSGTAPGFKISKPYANQQTTVCISGWGGNPIPNGFAAVEQGSYPACGLFGGYRIEPLSGDGPYTLCNANSIPSGYVITASVAGSCGITVVRVNPDGQNICSSIGTVPDGYVVTSTPVLASCPFNNGYYIEQPSTDSATFVCAISSVPEGFAITGTQQSHDECGGGLGYYILPSGSGAIVPAPFVNSEADVITKPSDPSITCSVGTIDGGLIGSASKNSAGCN